MAVSLQSKDGRVKYASTTFTNISTTWQHLSATLTTETTGDAQLAIEVQGRAGVALEFVSLLPAANVQAQGNLQNPFPFRADLLQMLRDLKPRWDTPLNWGCQHLWLKGVCDWSARPMHRHVAWRDHARMCNKLQQSHQLPAATALVLCTATALRG